MPGKYPYLSGKLDFTPFPPQPPQRLAVNCAIALSLLSPATGITHFARTGSAPSLVAGLGLGASYLFSYTRQTEQKTFGEETALIASALWAGNTVPEALKADWKSFPLVCSVLAVSGVVVFGVAVNNKRIAAWGEHS